MPKCPRPECDSEDVSEEEYLESSARSTIYTCNMCGHSSNIGEEW